MAVATGALTPEDAKTLAEIRERFAYQEAERFVTGYEEDIRFLLSLVSALSEASNSKGFVIMTPEEYAPGDWCSAEIVAARNLWDWHNPSKPVAELPGPIEDAWLIYLPIARVALYESLSLLADWEAGAGGDYEYYVKLKTRTRAVLHAIVPNRPDGESSI